MTPDRLPTFAEVMEISEQERRARARSMKTVDAAIKAGFVAYRRLQDLGFQEACYCPKDGSEFEIISWGSTGIHRCFYSDKWPDGYYMVIDGGDVYPTRERPMLWRPVKTSEGR